MAGFPNHLREEISQEGMGARFIFYIWGFFVCEVWCVVWND